MSMKRHCDGLVQLVVDMENATRSLEKLDDGIEWTTEELGVLEDVRGTALGLAREAEAIFKTIQGM